MAISGIEENMSSSYWNEEDDENIICPYCGKEYEPSYEDTYIGDDCVDCYTEDTGTPQSRNLTLTAMDGLRTLGCGLSNLKEN